MTGFMSIWHWLVVLLIVVLIFGTRKLSHLGKDLGSAVRGFKEGLQTDSQSSTHQDTASTDNSLNTPKQDRR